jgi:hypothetical protein
VSCARAAAYTSPAAVERPPRPSVPCRSVVIQVLYRWTAPRREAAPTLRRSTHITARGQPSQARRAAAPAAWF